MKKCLITGTNGYLGGRVKNAFEKNGWEVVELTRSPKPGSRAVRFQLGEELSPEALKGADALVHCAYDFKALSWPDIQAKNVAGSEKLLKAARDAGVRKLVSISSISAFTGCRSLYGKAKLEAEAVAAKLGAVSIRPGLIYGEPPEGIFGKLVKQVENAKVLPLFGGGTQIQFLIHEQDLCRVIMKAAEGSITSPTPLTIAHEKPWTFRGILEEVARAKGKRLKFIPVPWRLVWAAIKTAELCHVQLNFRSDSLVSLMHQNPTPDFMPQRKLGMPVRAFRFLPS